MGAGHGARVGRLFLAAIGRRVLDVLRDTLRDRRIAVLTGAGCSTESGIPDYRGPETARRARNPIQFRAFRDDPVARQRYWARSVIGFRRLSGARPNPAHRALAELERQGGLAGLITQNVDGLHGEAGSRDVIELHGAIRRVRCMACGVRSSRAALQDRLLSLNPDWALRDAEQAPDGDAEVEGTEGFRVPACVACGGPLKPDVVFFGENVARADVERAYGVVDSSEALLVVGTSLQVFSGYRFVKRAAKRGLPVALVNLGETRGDSLATVKIEGRAGEILPQLVRALTD